jgi:hypothetical protein
MTTLSEEKRVFWTDIALISRNIKSLLISKILTDEEIRFLLTIGCYVGNNDNKIHFTNVIKTIILQQNSWLNIFSLFCRKGLYM